MLFVHSSCGRFSQVSPLKTPLPLHTCAQYAHKLAFGCTIPPAHYSCTVSYNSHVHESPLQDPTVSPLLEGRWRLLFTTRPGSASPIQKTFVGVESFTVYQEVLLTSAEEARVNNIVDFGAKVGLLKVSQPSFD